MAEPFSIAILAGGRSRRMGSDKALAGLNGRPLLARLADSFRAWSDDLFIAGGEPGVFEPLGLPHAGDHFVSGAAMIGVYSALAAARHRLCFVIACDLPFVPPEAAAALAAVASRTGAADAVAPLSGRGPEPLCAVYAKSCLAPMRRGIERGELGMRRLLDELSTVYVEAAELPVSLPVDEMFFNVNTPDALRRAERLLAVRPADGRGQAGASEPLAARPVEPAPVQDQRPAGGVPLVCFVGRKDSGKTTFLEKLVPLLTAGGNRVAYIKHDVHGLSLDHEGTDTWRLTRAGASPVLIAAPEGTAAFWRRDREADLAALCRLAGAADIIIAEGFKTAAADRIEVSRGVDARMACGVEDLIAVVSDRQPVAPLPAFRPDDAAGVAVFLAERYGLAGAGGSFTNHGTGKDEQ